MDLRRRRWVFAGGVLLCQRPFHDFGRGSFLALCGEVELEDGDIDHVGVHVSVKEEGLVAIRGCRSCYRSDLSIESCIDIRRYDGIEVIVPVKDNEAVGGGVLRELVDELGYRHREKQGRRHRT